MPSEAENAVAAFFHASRSAAKKARRMERECPIAAGLMQRALWAGRYERAAERDAYEVGLD